MSTLSARTEKYLRASTPARWFAYSVVFTLPLAGTANANDGVLLFGYGAKAMGMGGASVALPQDSVASANNPAGMAKVGNRVDMDVTYVRESIETNVGANRYSDMVNIFVPTGGYNQVIDEDFTWGVSMFGQGVMLNYKEPVFGTKSMMSNLQQTVVAPTLTWRIAPGHFLGISPRFAYQKFEFAGMEHLGYASPGADKAYGAGFAVGYLGELNERLNIGLSYASPIWFQKLDRYRDLIPDGRLNMPQIMSAGVAFHLTPSITLAADYQWIDWAREGTYGNRMTEGGRPGESDSPGFGWRNQRIARFGASWEVDHNWTVRAGASMATELVPASEATFAALAPLIQRDHYTVGATYNFDNGFELTGSYIVAPGATLNGKGPSAGVKVRAESDCVVNVGIGYKF